ncbi:MAG TPA: helix-turn-helix domain-containing protein [Candidatus Limnocylindrales bacterium]
MASILRITFARACSDARISLDLTQQQVAERVGVSRSQLAKVELGLIAPSLDLVDRIAEVLGLQIALDIRPPTFVGGPRVRDAVHASCSAYVDRRLRALGWAVAREVEVIHGRSHGWIDLLAFDADTGTLLVIEIKTRLDDLGALERQMAWYERMAWDAARRLGWRPRRVVSCVIALASDEVERVARVHRDLLRLAFPMRAPDVANLLAHPDAEFRGRGIALVDPSSRRRQPVIGTSLDGRRSRLPYSDYADAVGRIRRARSWAERSPHERGGL